MNRIWTGSLSQRLRRRCRFRKTTLTWMFRILMFVALLCLVRQYAKQPGKTPRAINTRCKFPQLDINRSEILQHFSLAVPLQCNGEEDWVCVQGSRAGLCNATLDRYKEPITCQYDFLVDTGGTSDTVVLVTGQHSIQLKSDVFNVRCQTTDNMQEVSWEGKMAGVVPRQEALDRKDTMTDSQPEGLKINISVIVWDFGPMSRLTFMRKLPKTYSFIVEQLRGIVYTGYNSIGTEVDGTLLSVLTGSFKEGAAENQKFVWNSFKQRGYITALAIDDALSNQASSLSYKAEVDHNLRQLYENYFKDMSKHEPFCLAANPRHKVALDWIIDFLDVYPYKQKLAIVAQRELVKNSIIEMADEDNVNFFKTLQAKGHLDNTLVIVMSDSGPSEGSSGISQQAKMEERLPFLAIAVPLSFELDLPESTISLEINKERLVTQLDIHATLVNLLNVEDGQLGKRKQRAISLLAEIPAHRSCKEASIPDSFCTCLQDFGVSTSASIVRRATDQLVDLMNARTEEYRSVCAYLQLVSVVSSRKFVPISELLQRNNGHQWIDNVLTNYFNINMAEEELYHVTIITEPGSQKYAAYFYYIYSEDRLRFDLRWIKRDTDSDTKECVPGGPDELQIICQCHIF